MPPSETDPVEFAWHGHPWNIRPADPHHPHHGEYLIQKHPTTTSIPMSLRLLCIHLGITPPTQPQPLRTLATFLELTGKITPTTLPAILHTANLLRSTPHYLT